MKAGEGQKKWRAKPENKVKERIRDRLRQSDPRVKARKKLQALNRQGKVVKDKCLFCGTGKNIDCHHPDHFKWDEFICLCKSCHRKWHDVCRKEA